MENSLYFWGQLCAMLFLVCFVGFALINFSKSQAISSAARLKISKFKQEITLLSNSINILLEMSGKYYVTLNENGFQEICKIYSALSIVLEHCHNLLDKKRIKELREVLHFIYIRRGRGDIPQNLINLIGEQVNYTKNWASKVTQILNQITCNLEKNSNDLRMLCGPVYRTRKNTQLMISQARVALEGLI